METLCSRVLSVYGSLPKLLLLLPPQKVSGRQSWERNLFLHKLSLTTNLTFKFRFLKIHFIYYVFNLKQ